MIEIWHEEARNGKGNMDRDLELFELVRSGKHTTVFRTYEWKPWTVSLGKHQETDKMHVDKIEKRGYDLVWRPTGGRAVLHAQELTYCVAKRTQNAQALYASVHEFLRKQLNSISRFLDYEQAPTDLNKHYQSNAALGQVCFTSSARTELMAHNRKVVGSAQRVIEDIVLQHGSILIGDAHADIAEFLSENKTQEKTLRRRILGASISLTELAGREVTADEVRKALGTEFVDSSPPEPPTEEEEETSSPTDTQ